MKSQCLMSDLPTSWNGYLDAYVGDFGILLFNYFLYNYSSCNGIEEGGGA